MIDPQAVLGVLVGGAVLFCRCIHGLMRLAEDEESTDRARAGAARSSNNNNGVTSSVTLTYVDEDGRPRSAQTNMRSVLRLALNKAREEEEEEKKYLQGPILRHEVNVPEEMWERLKESCAGRHYAKMHRAFEGYRRSKMPFDKLLATLDDVNEPDGGFSLDFLSLFPMSEYVEMARCDTKVESDGSNALLWALCRGGDSLTVSDIDAIIEARPDAARQANTKGRVALHVAGHWLTHKPNMAVLRRVIDANPKAAETQDSNGYLPLHMALTYGANLDMESVRVLIDAFPGSVSATTTDGWTPLHLAATTKGNEELIKLLLEKGSGEELKARDKKNGVTPLQAALITDEANTCEEAHLRTIQALLTAWPGAAREADRHGNTALHIAAISLSFPGKGANVALLQTLHEAWTDAVRFRNSSGSTPLRTAIRCGAPMEAVTYLLDVSPASIYTDKDSHGDTLLHVLMTNPSVTVDVTRRVYEEWPSAIKERDREECIPLHVALLTGVRIDVIKFLLEKWHGSVKQIAVAGFTTLHCAVHIGRFSRQAAKRDAESGNNTNGGEQESSDDDNSSLISSIHGDRNRESSSDEKEDTKHDSKSPDIKPKVVDVEVIKFLHSRWPDAIERQAGPGATPLTEALLSGAPIETIQFLLHEYPRAVFLRLPTLEMTSLHCAMIGHAENADVVELIYQRNPKALLLQDNIGETPLHVGLKRHMTMESLNVLLGANRSVARVKAAAGLKKTPLQYALLSGAEPEIIERLLEVYPNARQVKDAEGNRPLDYAMLYRIGKRKEILRLLQNRRAAAAAAAPRNAAGNRSTMQQRTRTRGGQKQRYTGVMT